MTVALAHPGTRKAGLTPGRLQSSRVSVQLTGRLLWVVWGRMTGEKPDWDALLRSANAGDGRAFARFLNAVTPSLRRLVVVRGHALPAHLHEDIVQEVLFAIHRKRHTWDPASPVRPWLYAIARHKVVDAFRRQGTRMYLPVEDFADILEGDAPHDPSAARDTDRLLAQIDPRSAEIVRAIGIEGASSREAGARVDMTEGAVRVAFFRAMRKLSDIAKGGER